MRRTIRSAEHDGHLELTGGHIAGFRRVIDDLVERKDRKIPCHHFNDWTNADTGHSSTDTDSGKAGFRYRSIYDPFVSVFFPESLCYFVCAVILSNLFAHNEDAGIPRHLFVDCLIDRFTNL